jgi:hypothetical protein
MSIKPHPNAEPTMHAFDGNAVRILESASPRTAASQRRRTPLSLVPDGPVRRRAPFVVFCFAVLVAALATVLVLNITVSTGQYELVKLRNEQVSLAQENQSLTQQVENELAPQNLSAKAAELGMVASPSFGSIDLETLAVTGEPEAAQEGGDPDALVPAPAVAAPATGGAENPAREDPAREDRAAEAPAEEARVQDAPVQRTPLQRAPAAEAELDPAELNGGTIPAPMQQNGQ